MAKSKKFYNIDPLGHDRRKWTVVSWGLYQGKEFLFHVYIYGQGTLTEGEG